MTQRALLLAVAVAVAFFIAHATSLSPPRQIHLTISSRVRSPLNRHRDSPGEPPTTFQHHDSSPWFRNAAWRRARLDGEQDGDDGAISDSLLPTKGSASVSPDLIPSGRRRRIVRVQKYGRLPVWPAWNGVLLWILERILGDDAAVAAARLEDAWTGRVCPNYFSDLQATSPFVLVVHHVHSFANYDPLRWIQSIFFPEGFPAHPHRGFITLTYFLDGGFVHRDSTGCRQSYGRKRAERTKSGNDNPSLYHSQWLHTGAGILHEEMFDNEKQTWLWQSNRHELFQIWINVPGSDKLRAPYTRLLGPADTPTIVQWQGDGGGDDDDLKGGAIRSETTVLAGSYLGRQSTAPISSPLYVYHVILHGGATWTAELPSAFQTSFLYVRQGEVVDSASSSAVNSIHSTRVSAHSTAFFEATSESSLEGPSESPHKTIIVLQNSQGIVADFLFFAGEPLHEPVAVQGSMVMNTYNEINEAYDDYAAGKFGRPWNPKLSDEEWETHVQQFPSAFRSQSSS